MHDVQNIWHVPLVLEAQGAHESICKALNLGGSDSMTLGFWRQALAERWDNLAAVVSLLCSCLSQNAVQAFFSSALATNKYNSFDLGAGTTAVVKCRSSSGNRCADVSWLLAFEGCH